MSCSDSYLSCCSCPDNTYLCKHIFLVSRVKAIPFSARITSYTSAATAPTVTNLIENDDHNRRQEIFLATSSRINQKLAMYFAKFKNNSNSLDSMLGNMSRFENMLDSSISPNSFNNRQQ